ncbi:phage head closure protein [Cupriavidus plantarum]|uniref:phage head closure protein n=1 Tax=Cupriavidus plantarum TaxID=942865 RepID=UPI000EAE3993|nr:phage head closure protein [Cupriavidus plantarum]RLK45950.1 SPP1 family predicted phage head-tail adaptor [Cupriavidus plantarum]
MDIGQNNRRITLQRRQAGRKPSGQPVDEWIDVARPWAQILGKNGKSAMAADQEVSTVQYSMRIRYRTDVTAAWRVVVKGAVYDIKAVLPDEEGREHVDLVVELGASKG